MMSAPPTTDEKIRRIRKVMAAKAIHAVIIPSDDPHKSEYVAEYWQARKWATGFSGSAGTAVITMDKAILWTDFRYYIQAEEEIKGSEFELFKAGEPDVPAFDRWLADTLEEKATIGLDGALFSITEIKKYRQLFEPKGLNLDMEADLISALWTDRPEKPASKTYLFPEAYAGESRAEKIGRIRDEMVSLGADYHLMVSLDDIAWTLNIRGDDVHTNPVNIAFVLIGPKTTDLFIDREKIEPAVQEALEADRVRIFEYTRINRELSGLPGDQTVLIDPDQTSVNLGESVNRACRVIQKRSPAVSLKAVKNTTQITHMKETAVKDGIAMVNFLYWLENQSADDTLTEMSVAETLYDLRKKQPDFVDNSFDPIMAFRDHSAMCHYKATPESDVVIGDSGLFLTDSGGNYLTGTTDITRTISRSDPTRQEVIDYTLVLKGHIAVATVEFPKGTRGVQIDTLARQYLWKQGLDFGHGTGHGVGFFLCVHEGPARISPYPADEALKVGMLLTNEPGIYREGRYGIRLENMILVEEAFENEFGLFLKFAQMTLCHFERDLIDPALLSDDEKNWLNGYQKRVYEKISPGLETAVAAWLAEKTEPV
ncbi:MAG: aminopeptidase P family protein [Desulfobacterales bacterium]|nr:aminopeptidase P family protein [Desulfobacterales bacterium]